MKWIESWFTTYFFWRLYREYSQKGWAVVCKIPLLNIAFPDDSVQYFLCSFAREDKVRLLGTLPPENLVAYCSFTVYDTMGVPTDSLFDDQITTTQEGRYEITLGSDLKIPSSSYYCIIMRMYMLSFPSPLELEYTPSLIMDTDCQQILGHVSMKDLVHNSQTIEEKAVGFLSRRQLPSLTEKQPFYAPPSSEMASFFVNANATYLLATPDPEEKVLCVTGRRPTAIGRHENIRFVGFMACNLQTTATDASVSWKNLPVHYRVWVAFSEASARSAGYHGKDPLLLWKKNNAFPVLVYREVRVDGKGVKSQSEVKMDASACKKIMGPYYPTVV
jgi:hypothetical protein